MTAMTKTCEHCGARYDTTQEACPMCPRTRRAASIHHQLIDFAITKAEEGRINWNNDAPIFWAMVEEYRAERADGSAHYPPAAPRYGWIITKDHTSKPGENDSCTGIMGPRGTNLEHAVTIIRSAKREHFRLKDDDGNVMAEGYMAPLSDHYDLSLFEPLDDYGTGGLGATAIEVYQGHRWVCV